MASLVYADVFSPFTCLTNQLCGTTTEVVQSCLHPPIVFVCFLRSYFFEAFFWLDHSVLPQNAFNVVSLEHKLNSCLRVFA